VTFAYQYTLRAFHYHDALNASVQNWESTWTRRCCTHVQLSALSLSRISCNSRKWSCEVIKHWPI